MRLADPSAFRAVTPAGAAAKGNARALCLAILVAAAFVFRWPHFGHPNLHIDETFYLLAGDLLLEGQLPYVDLWDRKPIGLFLLYAAIRLLGGDGVLQYQIVAALFAAATAFVIALIARRRSGWMGSTAAGLVYLAFLEALSGGGGQSPVFYNLPVAGAALLTLRAADARTLRGVAVPGLFAMLLAGLAIQIKYTAVVEGGFFGLVLMWLVWRRCGKAQAALAWGVAFAAVGLAPTAAAFLAYAAMGHGEVFAFANFSSILLRPPTPAGILVGRLLLILFLSAPLVVVTIAALALHWRQGRSEGGPLDLLPLGWALAALVGFALIGTFYDHYALPLLAPFAVLCAPLLDRRAGPLFTACLVVWALSMIGYPTRSTPRTKAEIAALTSTVRQNLRGGCLFNFEGPPIVQHLVGGCRLTPYLFPYHLNAAIERKAIGVDPASETRRILAARPAVIITSTGRVTPPNRETHRIVRGALARDYRLVDKRAVGKQVVHVYARTGVAASSPGGR